MILPLTSPLRRSRCLALHQSKDASTRNRGWDSGQRNNRDFFFDLYTLDAKSLKRTAARRWAPLMTNSTHMARTPSMYYNFCLAES